MASVTWLTGRASAASQDVCQRQRPALVGCLVRDSGSVEVTILWRTSDVEVTMVIMLSTRGTVWWTNATSWCELKS